MCDKFCILHNFEKAIKKLAQCKFFYNLYGFVVFAHRKVEITANYLLDRERYVFLGTLERFLFLVGKKAQHPIDRGNRFGTLACADLYARKFLRTERFDNIVNALLSARASVFAYPHASDVKRDIVGDDDRLREEKIKKEIKNIVETYFWLPDKQRILWNVVNLAFTDAELAPSEKRIIDFLAKQFEIPQEIYDDMFDVAQTMLALVNEEQRLKAFPDEDNKEKIEAIKSKINDLYNYVTALVEMADVK